MQQYHYPLEDGFTERIHTPGGVRSLVEGSHLMKLLRDLDKDGFNVDGPLAELTALINYVTSSQMSMLDLQTHLDYCAIVIGHWQNPVPGLASRVTKWRIPRQTWFFYVLSTAISEFWWAGQGSERTPVPLRPVRQPCPVHHQ